MWLVCFSGRQEKRYWWDKIWLTTKYYRHCFVIQYQIASDHWVLVDWRTGVCDVISMKRDEIDYIFNHLRQTKGTALLVKQRCPDREIHYRVPLIYCVQAVLQILGMPTNWTFTPQQLYKRLINLGCEELINYRSISHG